MPLLLAVPITRLKIIGARILYRFVKLAGYSDFQEVERQGLHFRLDLREGIDLSVFLFGAFQKHVFQNKLYRWKPDALVLDVGANAGFMTLQFAARCPQGQVFAFEPTHYAVQRFEENMRRNPELAARIRLYQCFVSDVASENPQLLAFASWPLAGAPAGVSAQVHQVHLGHALSTQGVKAITLDNWMDSTQPHRVDFIKIDTDGHEWQVLQGAQALIKKFRPVIIFEVGRYVMREKGLQDDAYLGFFKRMGYRLFNSANGREIKPASWKKQVPALGTIDILALPLDQA
ncbi:MAG: FkbM family methyltransferase [Flavobacteriales bacterium]|nr:FkbM family methyltransferase [Flavobacteriales bacterium]